jgi:hypothetical protein
VLARDGDAHVFINGVLIKESECEVNVGDRIRLGSCDDVLEWIAVQPNDNLRKLGGPELVGQDEQSESTAGKKRMRRDSVEGDIGGEENLIKKVKSEPLEEKTEIKVEEERVVLPIPVEKEKQEPAKVRASHILVKHVESRNPSSWKSKKIVRTKADAYKKMQNILDKIVSTLNVDPSSNIFEKIAQTESDCSSAKNAGDLNFFVREKMMPEFSNAAFALKVGEISGIVETASGWHIIKRTA